MNLILASESPYRKELLERLHIPFQTSPSHIDEDIFKESLHDVDELTKVLAFEKAKKVLSENPNALVIGSDQALDLNGEILGKPKTKEKAIKQLLNMSGKTHTLVSAVCLLGQNQKIEFINKTKLTLRNLTLEEITHYINIDNPVNCAGSYMIEGLGISLFSKIEMSDFTSIIGLPLIQLCDHLKEFGLNPLNPA